MESLCTSSGETISFVVQSRVDLSTRPKNPQKKRKYFLPIKNLLKISQFTHVQEVQEMKFQMKQIFHPRIHLSIPFHWVFGNQGNKLNQNPNVLEISLQVA